MRDISYGSMNGRHLTLRLFAPSYFERWDGDRGIRFSPWRLLNPLAWLRSILRGRYDWWWSNHPNRNHRCYCQEGRMIDFSLVVAGWGIVVFYSHYTGEVPCVCDKVYAEMFGEETEEVEA